MGLNTMCIYIAPTMLTEILYPPSWLYCIVQCVPWYLVPFNRISNVCINAISHETYVLNCPLQHGSTPLHLAMAGDHKTCVERLVSIPGIEVKINAGVSCCSI